MVLGAAQVQSIRCTKIEPRSELSRTDIYFVSHWQKQQGIERGFVISLKSEIRRTKRLYQAFEFDQ